MLWTSDSKTKKLKNAIYCRPVLLLCSFKALYKNAYYAFHYAYFVLFLSEKQFRIYEIDDEVSKRFCHLSVTGELRMNFTVLHDCHFVGFKFRSITMMVDVYKVL